MTSALLARLAGAGVLERTGRGAQAVLRVTPRFLDHAGAVAHRMGRPARAGGVLETALATWDETVPDWPASARVLEEFLDHRHQWGMLRPVFPVLEAYS